MNDTTILDHLPLGACVIDDGLRVHFWNQTLARWSGRCSEEMQGADLGAVFPNLLTPKYRNRLDQVFESGSPAIYSAGLHSHFIPIPSLVSAKSDLMIQQTYVRRISRGPHRALVCIHDFTAEYLQLMELRDEVRERKKMLLQLQEANVALEQERIKAISATKAKSEFLANMSHEIRIPMTAILGYAELLSDPSFPKEDGQKAIETITRNGNHLLAVINEILDISKIEAGLLEISPEACSLSTLMQDVVSLLKVRAENKGLKLTLNYLGTLPELIDVDPVRLRQVLVNLIGNAIKFTGQGEIVVDVSSVIDEGVEPLKAMLTFVVIDSGVGIREEYLEEIFNPFSQGDSSVTRVFGGTGLGLTISRKLVQMMGGEIHVQSQINRGSKFTVTMPAPVVRMQPQIEQSTASVEMMTPCKDDASTDLLRKSRVLLVDDSLDNRRLFSFLLKRMDCEVTTAENGLDAIEKYEAADGTADEFSLILMDMQMPILDGYEATRRLKSSGCRIPIIAITAHTMQGDHEKCLAAGCDGYLSKPINREQMNSVINAVLNRSTDVVTKT